MTSKHDFGPLTFGFDIGIASVGWAVLCPDHIVDLGVRCFDAAEDKDGKPNNQTRRGARVSRNRYQMRTWRLKRLVRLFRDVGLLSNSEAKQLFSGKREKCQSELISPWTLRAKGLTEKLTPQEWAQVIYYMVKHRGFKFFSKTDDPRNSADADDTNSSDKTAEQKEREGLRDGLEYTAKLLKKYPQFKTIGDAAFQLANAQQGNDGSYRDKNGDRLEAQDCEEFRESFRNKGKSYRHAFHRDDLLAELALLFEVQHLKGNPHAVLVLREEIDRLREVQISSETRPLGSTFRDQVFALVELQHPPIYTSQMDALIGDCELENEARNGRGKAERRAAKHSFSNERATWLQTINNLRIRRTGRPDAPLSAEERAVLIDLPYTQAKVTFKQVREVLRANFGFPAQWREASFTSLSYRNKRKNDGSWINVITTEGQNVSLGKYGPEDIRKEANKKLKAQLEASVMTFAKLRQLFKLKEGEAFECIRNEAEIVPVTLESTYTLPDGNRTFIKLLPAKSKKTVTLKGRAMKALADLSDKSPEATLASLREEIDQADKLEAGWQFEFCRKEITPINTREEAMTQVPIAYEDAQKIEEETLIELKGWHTFKRALETDCPDLWASLQNAYLNPQADAGKAVAKKIDDIAELLTKAQTDADVDHGLAKFALTVGQIKALEGVRFKQYRNLSLKALRKILPELESGKSHPEACKNAGYEPVVVQRTKLLPPLETYLYERIRHGKKTKYTELRYKDLTNPVVARAFNQARLVLNALIARHGSPAYIHVELARDIAKPKFGHKNAQGKYIEGRDDIQKKQEENRSKRKAERQNFIENYRINEPNSAQILKARLYQEQQGKCLYTLDELDLDQVVSDPNYAQIDHIWPRSRTFDNSMENLALVHARANQNKGNSIPYDFIRQNNGDEHWHRVMAYILGCKGISGNKQKRLLATELDADEFSARNLVDTRYSTRLFARMVRDRLLFDGQVEDKVEDIEPSESGRTRLDKFQRTRVRTPQGGLTAFLRRGWLGDIKDRAAGDKHHALDACIVASCTQKVINEVNSFFANEEKVPNRFRRNTADGTYTDRATGEIVSKQTARERGLYLPPPWDGFRAEFMAKYQSVFVTRAIRKKRNVELHDANPLRMRYYPVRLLDLTMDMMDINHWPANLPAERLSLIQAVRSQLVSSDGDAAIAFANGLLTKNARGEDKIIHSIPLPLVALPPEYLGKAKRQLAAAGANENFKDTAIKSVPLNKLSTKALGENALGSAFYHRNKRMIEALKAQLTKCDDDAEKAFPESAFHPFGKDRPVIKSIRLPAPRSSGIHVRGGIANLGDALYAEMYKHDGRYWFRARYKVAQENAFGLPVMPAGAQHICNLQKNDFVKIKHPNLSCCYAETGRYTDSHGNNLITVEALFRNGTFMGYWNYFEPSNDRPVVQLHDGSHFFLLEDGKRIDKDCLTLIESPKKRKNAKSPEEFEYFEFLVVEQTEPPLKFSRAADIKRKVADATLIEKIRVDLLGKIQDSASNGLA